MIQWWPLLIPLIVFVFAYRAWDKTGRDPKEESVVVRYEPVDGVSPAALGKLARGERESPMCFFTATMVDLAIRGFLRIEETPPPNTLVTLGKDIDDIAQSMRHGDSGKIDYIIHFARRRSEWKGLKRHEEHFLEGLINAASSVGGVKRDVVRVSMLWNKFYVSVPEISEAIESELVSKGYYRTSPGSAKKWLFYGSPLFVSVLLGWFLKASGDLAWWRLSDDPFAHEWEPQSADRVLLTILLSVLILIIFGSIMPSRSVAGARAREAALGFKEFLGRVNTMPSEELFERYLPYAIAFGVESTWAHSFDNVYVTAPDWYTAPMRDGFSASSFAHRISDLSTSAATSMSSSL